MALLIDGRIPPRWAEHKGVRPSRFDSYSSGAECVRIGLINNMPDAALEDTEMQFMELLDRASTKAPVCLKLYSLPKVPRSDRGLDHLANFYTSTDELWNDHVDAVIITGTEPKHSDLRQESYWNALTEVFDWAERNTVSTILSCLAAHAGVLHTDGIPRHPLGDKRFGVFECEKPARHVLTRNATQPIKFPHSRWNEVREDALVPCGYTVLTKSTKAGVDSFVKQKRKSLFVHFQGHPEYGAHTLLKEYRRDVKRFLRQERETYPTAPYGYFDAAAIKLLNEFQESALSNPREEQMLFFPESLLTDTLRNTWQASAVSIYGNWLEYILSKKSEQPALVRMAQPMSVRARVAESELA
jgi:homoserine O-succinyltransferase/O-acetyltransferase